VIEYSPRSRRAYGRLLRNYNDIDVYVEDSSLKGLYERVVNRALDGRARVTRVIPLGPKADVLAAAASDVAAGGRKRLYVVDGDLDLIAWWRQKTPSRVYRLRVYCIENLLFEDGPVRKYCAFACPQHSEEDLSRLVATHELAEDVDRYLSIYFLALGIARRLGLRGGVYSLNPPSVTKLRNGHNVGVDPRKIRRRIVDIVRAIRKAVGHSRYQEAKKAVLRNVSRKRLRPVQYVSGKDFLLYYLNGRVVASGGRGLDRATTASYLADYCGLTQDRALVRRLRRVAAAA
jgi:hypothetical protein